METETKFNNGIKHIRPFAKLRFGLCDICRMLCSNQLSSLNTVETDFRELIRGQLCGANADKILEKLCKVNGWDINQSKSFNWDNSIHKRVSVDEQMDVWFIDNPTFDNCQVDAKLEEYHFVNLISDGEYYVCEIFEDMYGSYFCSKNHILTFVKTNIGYVFLGVYRVHQNYCDWKTVRNYYWREYCDFPLPTPKL